MPRERVKGLVRSARSLAGAVGVGALVAWTTACGDGAEPGGSETTGRAVVVATTTIWADVVANVVCDGSAVVATLIPAGADPHAFEASLADRADLDSAVLIVANGLGLEEGLEDTLASAERDGTPMITMGDHVDTIRSTDGNGGAPDPHVWLDPVRVAAALPVLVERLVTDGGLNRAALDACLDTYQAELADVDGELADLLGALAPERRKLVTSHESLGYLADRYDLEVIGSVIPATSTLVETNPAALEHLAEAVEDAGVDVIFAESRHSTADTEALAERLGDVEVVVLDVGSLDEPGGEADSYTNLVRHTGRVIAEALG